jgi:hypothetical protein
LQSSDTSRHSVHCIARLESCYIRADSLNDPGQVHSEDRWKCHSRVSRTPRPDFGIQWINPAGLDPNEDLTRVGYGTVYFGESERGIIAIEYKSSHVWRSSHG